jgi:hypothetical protein
MRSIVRGEPAQWTSCRSANAVRSSAGWLIEIFWGKPMPGTASGRGRGKCGCGMTSLPCRGAAEDRLAGPSLLATAAGVLGRELNRSEAISSCRACGPGQGDRICNCCAMNPRPDGPRARLKMRHHRAQGTLRGISDCPAVRGRVEPAIRSLPNPAILGSIHHLPACQGSGVSS